MQGAMFSNSKIGLAGILAEEGRFGDRDTLQAFEGQRAASLPWVEGLSIPQTLELRAEAQQALPSLRAFLSRTLAARPLAEQVPISPGDYVAELREQAAAVESELKIATSKHRSLARNSLGILSLGISAYGIASDSMSPVAGLAQLLATLGLLHEIHDPNAQLLEREKSKPGYVLVAAKSILARAHASS